MTDTDGCSLNSSVENHGVAERDPCPCPPEASRFSLEQDVDDVTATGRVVPEGSCTDDGQSWCQGIAAAVESNETVMPIPPLPPPPRPKGKSRRVRQRFGKAFSLWLVAERLRTALNNLWGNSKAHAAFGGGGEHGMNERPGPCRITGGQPICDAEPVVKRVWIRLLRRSKLMQEGRRAVPTGAAWTRELCRSAAELYTTSVDTPYVPFQGEMIAEPELGAREIDILSVLPERLAKIYAREDLMLRSEAPQVFKTMNGRFSRVLGKQEEWIKYLHRREVWPLWNLAPAKEAKGMCSVAAVPKRSGDKLRKILMTCPFNEAALDVPTLVGGDPEYGLLGGGALAQVHSADDSMEVATLDESNAFTPLVVPVWWQKYQAGPKVRAGDLPREWTRGRWKDDEWLRPQYRRLGMGHTHAVFILMRVNRVAIDRTISRLEATATPMKVHVLHDSRVLQRGVELDNDTVAVYMHVDDIGAISATRHNSDKVMHMLAEELEEIGFQLTTAVAGTVQRYVGLRPRSHPAGWEPVPVKLGLLDAALKDLTNMATAPLKWLRAVVAHYVHWSPLWRPAMSVVHATYSLLQLDAVVVPVWPSVRRELVMMRGILPLLYGDTGRRNYHTVLAQDAAGPSGKDGQCKHGAFCLAIGRQPKEEIDNVMGRREVQDEAPLPTEPGMAWMETATGSQMRTLSRTVLPWEWFDDASRWNMLLARHWHWPLHISQGETKAAGMWLPVLARRGLPERTDCLDLSDNEACVGLLSKGRSPVWALNRECQKRAAVEGAYDIHLKPAWVDTHHQPGDEGTRANAEGKLRIGQPMWMCAFLFVEVFAGSARVTSAARSCGIKTLDPWDILYGTMYDLLRPKNVRKLLRILSSGHVFFAWWGTPCHSFSIARRWDGGPRPLRCDDNVEAHTPWCTPEEIAFVEGGNDLAKLTALGVRTLARVGAYYVVENPLKSRMWELEALVQALESTGADKVRTDFCGWSTRKVPVRWQKSTLLAGTLPGLKTLERRCRGGPYCTYTGKQHVVLRGKAPDGRYWTQVAEPYPLSMCDAVGNLAAAALSLARKGHAEVGQ